jgi:hypothetical protein
MVDHEETYTALQGHVWEGPSEVAVDDTGMSVSKCTEAEEVAMSWRVVVLNDMGSRRAGKKLVGGNAFRGVIIFGVGKLIREDTGVGVIRLGY